MFMFTHRKEVVLKSIQHAPFGARSELQLQLASQVKSPSACSFHIYEMVQLMRVSSRGEAKAKLNFVLFIKRPFQKWAYKKH